jgi:uncharacterized protein (TIGR02996 family)
MSKLKSIPTEQAALLRAIVAAPDDDTPRLVYADWLQENDDATQGEFIRESIALARMKPRAKKRKALAHRLREVARTNGPQWLAAIGVAEATDVTYVRGFPDRVTFESTDEFFAASDALFEFVPLRGLGVAAYGDGDSDDVVIRKLAKIPQLSRLTDLRLWELQQAQPASWRKLFRSPHLKNLTYLSVAGCGMYDAETKQLASAPPLANLTDLDLSYNSIGVVGAFAILESRYLTRLKNLWLEHNFFGDEDGEEEVLEFLGEHLGNGLHLFESPEDDEDEDD